MKKFTQMSVVVVCLVVFGLSQMAAAQSTQKRARSYSQRQAPQATMAAKPMSRAFTNGYNVPSNGVALEGYCPVCYLAVNKAVRGTAQFSYTHNGVTYWFVNENARQAFIANPEKFTPAYGGWCAIGVAMGQRFPVDPEHFKIVDGRIMLFLRNAKVDALDLWNRDEAGNLRKADENWKKLGS